MLISSNFASKTIQLIFTLGPQMHQATLVKIHDFILLYFYILMISYLKV